MINCQNMLFSPKLSQQRIEQSQSILGVSILQRLLCFSLYNLGVNRNDLSNSLKLPPGTVRSTIRAINRGGLAAFEDRRKKITTTDVSPPLQQTQKISVNSNDKSTIITIGGYEISIPKSNPLQTKVFLFTLLNNGILSNFEVAETLNISKAHVSNLSKGLRENDIFALIDKRQGQQKDYVVAKNIKSELIQQFVANIVTGGSISSSNITNLVNEACNTNISDRTIRQHISKLNLKEIKHTLSSLLDEIKKNSKI